MRRTNDISRERLAYLRGKRNNKIFVIAMRFAILTAFFALWEMLARFGVIDSFLMSSPSRIISTIKRNTIVTKGW